MYRTVFVTLECQRCRRAFRNDVQFRTGRDWLEVYEAGSTVPMDDDLAAGRYEGYADRYCSRCEPGSRDDFRDDLDVVLGDDRVIAVWLRE